jgi:hypothetical protein
MYRDDAADGVHRFEVDVTEARLAEVAPWLTRALQLQNARLSERFDIGRRAGPLRVVGLVLSTAGLAVSLLLGAVLPEPGFVRVLTAVFVVQTLVLIFLPQLRRHLRAWARRAAGRRLSAVANRTLRRSFARARYAVEYQVAPASDTPRDDRCRLVLNRFPLAMTAPGAVFLFARPTGLQVNRLLLLPNEMEEQRVHQALRAVGATVEAVPAQSPPGY